MSKQAGSKSFWGLSTKPWLTTAKSSLNQKDQIAHLWIAGPGKKAPSSCPKWLWEEHTSRKRPLVNHVHWTDESGPHWLVAPEVNAPEVGPGSVEQSSLGKFRDAAGSALAEIIDRRFDGVIVESLLGEKKGDEERQKGALLGLELSQYRFQKTQKNSSPIQLKLVGFAPELVKKAGFLGLGTNLARHLVNLPAGDLNPTTYGQSLKELFQGSDTTVEIWNTKKLEAEKCGMLLAVGRAAKEPSCLIRLKYRPKGSKSGPIAIVGKGITFDSGGLDIKPAAGMRLMKKDMGGSASVAGLAFWADRSKLPRAVDFYLACAENAIDGNAFRPGDILQSRKGLSVEIHNTDAEGRLVLGDAIDVAATRTGKDKPALIIDLATLTGAMRVALGLQVAGFFSTDEALGKQLYTASLETADPMWQMPLVEEYNALLASSCADISNAASVGFGGAITAALFLRRFISEMPWMHVDMMAWTDKRSGALAEPGGNGQAVQALASFLQSVDVK